MKFLDYFFAIVFGIAFFTLFACLVFSDLANSQFLTLLSFTFTIGYAFLSIIYLNKKN